MSAFKPIVEWFEERDVSKGISITLTYIFVFLILMGLASLIFIPFGKEIQNMIEELPALLGVSLIV
jgi:predicted PurR-regulated permease PerM